METIIPFGHRPLKLNAVQAKRAWRAAGAHGNVVRFRRSSNCQTSEGKENTPFNSFSGHLGTPGQTISRRRKKERGGVILVSFVPVRPAGNLKFEKVRYLNTSGMLASLSCSIGVGEATRDLCSLPKRRRTGEVISREKMVRSTFARCSDHWTQKVLRKLRAWRRGTWPELDQRCCYERKIAVQPASAAPAPGCSSGFWD